MRLRLVLAALLTLAGPVRAGSGPHVVADIAPVHSLVAQVMDGVAMPELLVTASQSAHGVALRPSQMQALQSSDLVIWVGRELTPWLDKALHGAQAEDRSLALLEAPQTLRLRFRQTALFAPAHEGDHESDHGVGHDDHETHMDADGHDHGHDGIDPHAWLDPENAIVWMGLIADRLVAVDPENAATYRANAEAGAKRLRALMTEIAARLAPARAVDLLAFHDAYRYFESRFGLTFVGAVTSGDAAGAGPGRLRAVQAAIRDNAVVCAFAEPQFNPRLLAAVTEGSDVNVSVLDPLGKDLEPGPTLYADLLRAMAASIADCVDG